MNFLGLDLQDIGVAEAVRRIAARPAQAPFAYVVTPNADHFARLIRDPNLRPLYEHAWLRLLDSRFLNRFAAAVGVAAPSAAPGSDVTAMLLRDGIAPDDYVTVVGLRPEWLPALRSNTGLRRIAHQDPPMGFEHDPVAFQATVDFVLRNPARYVFLAVGSPRQEKLAAAIAATGQATGIGLCIGASLEFVAGTRWRAPKFLRDAGLEWLARLVTEPHRLGRRYLVDCPVVLAHLRKARSTITRRTNSASEFIS